MTAAVQLKKPEKHTLFQPGDTLIYFHKWKGWGKPKNQTWFHNLTPEECVQLAPGDQVWVDIDPLDQHGKVYGSVMVTITNISGNAEAGIRVGYTSPTVSGASQITYTGKLAILTNEEQVYNWTKDIDAARNV